MILKHKPVKYILIALLLLIAFVGGWYAVIRIASPYNVVKTVSLDMPVSAQPKLTEHLLVGCYNIAHGRGGKLGTDNWDGGTIAEKTDRLKLIADFLVEQKLDIVVLNEVDFKSYWSGHLDQSIIIAKQAGYPYLVRQRNVDVGLPWKRLCFGNVILSKYPITNAEFLDFPNPSKAQDIFVGGMKDGVVATISLPDDQSIQVAAVHLSLEGETTRNASVEMILAHQKKTGLPTIAMGDFNSTAKGFPDHHTNEAGTNCIDTLIASGQLDTFPLKKPPTIEDFTFPTEKPIRTIDWIFASNHWKIKKYFVLQSDLSDHLPVIATVEYLQPQSKSATANTE